MCDIMAGDMAETFRPLRCRHYVSLKHGELIVQRCIVMLVKNGVLRFVFFVLMLVNGVIHSCVNSEEFGVDQTYRV